MSVMLNHQRYFTLDQQELNEVNHWLKIILKVKNIQKEGETFYLYYIGEHSLC